MCFDEVGVKLIESIGSVSCRVTVAVGGDIFVVDFPKRQCNFGSRSIAMGCKDPLAPSAHNFACEFPNLIVLVVGSDVMRGRWCDQVMSEDGEGASKKVIKAGLFLSFSSRPTYCRYLQK